MGVCTAQWGSIGNHFLIIQCNVPIHFDGFILNIWLLEEMFKNHFLSNHHFAFCILHFALLTLFGAIRPLSLFLLVRQDVHLEGANEPHAIIDHVQDCTAGRGT
jgi:hypothetical protein